MAIKEIKTEFDYEAAMARLEELWAIDPAMDTPEGDELDKLITLIDRYEYEQERENFSLLDDGGSR